MDKNTPYKSVPALSALGVVFGDIGTSPLYAFKETIAGLVPNALDILGILSLIFWALIFVISIKYLVVVFRADNEGEGGCLALLALLRKNQNSPLPFFYFLAIFGAGLLLGDGMLTPAISVVSAVEGVALISSSFSHFIVPIACFILIVLFFLQYRGTSKIGFVFGPIVLLWFLTIALLGCIHILHNTSVLRAMHPYYAYHFLHVSALKGYLIFGGVFLAVTGGEALYADIGHFGKRPIRQAWFFVALPCLVLNYFGQGAYLLLHPENITHPFYSLAPPKFYIPLVLLATAATIIASQSVITAVFSLMRQAIIQGFYPRVPIIQTSHERMGEIYIPNINFIMLFGTLMLILFLRSSTNLAHAYGIAVNLDMLLVSIMVAYAARVVWKWSYIQIFAVFGCIISVDLTFLGANGHKFLTNGWIPVSFALLIALVMYTWTKGLHYLKHNYHMDKEDISRILSTAEHQTIDLSTIFITDTYNCSGSSLLHFLKLCRIMPRRILIVNYVINNIPHVRGAAKYEIHAFSKHAVQLTLHYGFMDNISIPKALKSLQKYHLLPFEINPETSTYLVEIPHMSISKDTQALSFWQKHLFTIMVRNYSVNLNINFYQLPHNKTLAIGTYCII